jgi:glycosyltransferase involved in cell wall biosynthesis
MHTCISLIIPTYNRLWALSRVLRQFYDEPLIGEIIVVDDGSIDDTKEWLNQEAATQPKLKPVFHSLNKGLPAARNTGMGAAKYDYIMFWDDDLLLYPQNGIQILFEELQAHNGDVIAPAFYWQEGPAIPALCGPKSTIPNLLLNRLLLMRRTDEKVIKLTPECTFQSNVLTSGMLLRRTILESLSYDTGLGWSAFREETDIQLSILERGGKLLACPLVWGLDLKRPPNQDGGCRSQGVLLNYETVACRNNWRMLKRHHDTIRDVLGVNYPIHILQITFVLYRFGYYLPRKIVGKLLRKIGLRK